MRRTLALPTLLLTMGLSGGTPVLAGSILYSLTDVGKSGFDYQTRADGSTYGLTSNSTGVTYVFDKTPTIAISESITSADKTRNLTQLTLQSGAYKVGQIFDNNPDDVPNKPSDTNPGFVYPSFEPHTNDWRAGFAQFPMVQDINKQGQVVGDSLTKLGVDMNNPLNYYAAFSAPGVQAHGGQASVVDNLNSYIAAQPGMSLIFSLGIDDLGRILAVGSDDHNYLLTPVELGSAATVTPEPTVLLTLGLPALAWLAHSRRSRPRIML